MFSVFLFSYKNTQGKLGIFPKKSGHKGFHNQHSYQYFVYGWFVSATHENI